jgi:hypothetical protein
MYPTMKVLTLAKLIFKENWRKYPSLKSVESVRRNYLLGILGCGGKYNREHSDKSLHREKNYDTTNSKPEAVNTGAKILVLDIETAPIRAYVWGIWNQNVSINQIESDWFCLTWAAKWLFDKKVYSGSVTPEEAVKQDDRRIIKSLWALLNEADIVIAHNAQKFDIPKINSRFLIHGLNPPLPYQTIDTLLHIRRQFGFTSNKLDYVNQLLNLPRKQDTGGFELWEKCYKGEAKSIKKMLLYNIQDVRILEETYLRIRAWIKPHPSMGLYILDEGQSRCPSCGSEKLKQEGKNYHTPANAYEQLRCDNCGATSRKRLSAINIKQKRHLILSSAK